jgi:hypothetical protein
MLYLYYLKNHIINLTFLNNFHEDAPINFFF